MMDTMGVIIACNDKVNLGELERVRSVSAMPFGGRYRLIDFVLSGMVNSNIINVGVATDYNYQSLLDHLGSGKPWDLARKKYGLFILPPFARHQESISGDMEMNLLTGILHYMKRSSQKYVIVADCNNVCNIRFDDVVAQHRQSGADITLIYQKTDKRVDGEVYAALDENNCVTGLHYGNGNKNCTNRLVGYYVFTKEVLVSLLEKCQLQGKNNFLHDIIGATVSKGRVTGYCFNGYLRSITDIDSYYKVSMDLFDSRIRRSLFVADDKILTKTKDKVPTRYLSNAEVKSSIIADGCIIDGIVENSILFRGVTVEKGAVIKNSIIMQDCVVSESAMLDSVIMDKNCVIRKGKMLVGQPDFPIVVGKRRTI